MEASLPAILIVTKTIVFVCEHGAAKSIVAAAHFNRLAEQQHLPYRAVARGTEPQAELAPSAVNGLKAEGLQPPLEHPKKLTKSDVDGAARVVAFCEIPNVRAERWEAPAVGDGYGKAREVIVERVKALLAALAAGK